MQFVDRVYVAISQKSSATESSWLLTCKKKTILFSLLYGTGAIRKNRN